MKKRFSIRYKLIIIFGTLILAAGVIEGLLAVRSANKAVTEKVEMHLIDKATDTAEILDGRVNTVFQFLEGIARIPVLRDDAITFRDKMLLLAEEAKFNSIISELYITDKGGILHNLDGSEIAFDDTQWFQAGMNGEKYTEEPYIDVENNIFITFSLPVYDDSGTIIGVLGADVDGSWLSNQIADIVVGETGDCYILDKLGNTIADKDFSLVENSSNAYEESKTDVSLESVGTFEKMAVQEEKSSIGYFEYKGIKRIASYARMKTTGWTVIINAPVNEFMGTVNTLRISMLGIGAVILLIALVVIYFVACAMVKPVKTAVDALKDIARGGGDLTVCLPIHGNDEVTDLSEYFNETIAKIGSSIRHVGVNSSDMEEIGDELASNMTETASAINEISANIDGVKQQAMTQAASVTETAATVEEIVRTIKQLNNSIETQAASVAQSSSSVEEMVANIASIGQTLGKTDEVIKTLTTATGDGKATLVTSNTVTQKIAEESGSLMEASSVIQHIASQTNLLAMNAAIEAAHAGEAGKGFAVVADEIRKLAEDSAAQGKTITSTLKTLSGEIETLSASSKTVEEKFNVIFTLAAQVKEMSDRLTEAMREQENGSREVLIAIKSINTVTTEVQAGSEEMLKGGESVAEEMRKLDGLTRVITDSMNEMSSGAVQINNAIQEVSEITQKNKRSIEALAQEVSKFKT
ncbi:HAMP domain-containing protein [Treponema sp. OMZ 305]|uniref:methyl-accepting chemotaxis protein n=1 Tax=Treponema sp. OMZ 305 TaxID=1659192 RepID=UPI0020A242F6|nr:cache domain-containing protein [Treponema sp. OMZ 305]UTC57758.1 HAMP domain-containing protein [Treponema sp. OMZ 305]